MRKEADMNDSDLDDIFAEARVTMAGPSPDLMARVLADAEAHQPATPGLRRAVPPPRQGLWAAMMAAIGGGAALAGLSTATVAGLWIGFAQPTTLLNVTDSFLPTETLESVDLLPSFDTILTEG
jgi:hypothetical protein